MFTDSPIFSSFAVKDVDTAKAFYADTLGLDVTEQYGGLTLKSPSGGQVMVYPKPDHEPAVFTVLNITVPDVSEAVIDLKAKGVEFESYDNPEYATGEDDISTDDEVGMSVAWFKDPDGNIVSLMQVPADAPI